MEEKKAQILLIAKDSGINDIIALMLRKRDCCVLSAGTEAEIADAIRRVKPDVIIFDIIKWGIDEMMINKEIKTNKKLKGTPVIFCLPRYVKEIVPYKNDNDGYLPKPFKFEELYKKICALISEGDNKTEVIL